MRAWEQDWARAWASAWPRPVQPRRPRLVIKGDPDFVRVLRRQSVKVEGAHEAKDAVRDALTDLREGMLRGDLGTGQQIKSAPGTLDKTRRDGFAQLDAVDAVAGQVARAADARRAKGGTQAFLQDRSHNVTSAVIDNLR